MKIHAFINETFNGQATYRADCAKWLSDWQLTY